MDETRLRIALVGAGRRGLAHLSTIRELSHLYTLVAVCDIDGARASTLAETCHVPAYTDPRELLAGESPDAILIATPPETHHILAHAAAGRGVHMLTETPLALTRAMMDLIGEEAENARIKVEVGENYGRRPGERLNRLAIGAGLIGSVVHASVFNAPANHGTCYHTASLLRLYIGADVEEVQAIEHSHKLDSGPNSSSPQSETWTDAELRFGNGVMASCSYVSSWTSPRRWGRPRIVSVEGTEGYIVSTEGTMNRLHRIENGAALDYSIESETRKNGDRDVPERFSYGATLGVELANPFAHTVRTDAEAGSAVDGLARAAQLASLHRAVTTGAPTECGLATARRAQEVGIAIAESARLGRALHATLGSETTWEHEQHEALRRRWGVDPLKDLDALLGAL